MVIYRLLALYQIQFQTMGRINILPSFTKTTLKACHLCVVRSPKVHDDLPLSLNVCNDEKEYLEFFTCQYQLELIFSSPCFSMGLWLLNILNMSNIHGAYSKILSMSETRTNTKACMCTMFCTDIDTNEKFELVS